MKKIIIPLTIFFVIFFFVGLFFAKKETALKISKTNLQEKKVLDDSVTNIATTSPFHIKGEPGAGFILEFETKINEEVSKLTEQVKSDEKIGINNYYSELTRVLKTFKPIENTQQIDPKILINIAQDLSKMNPPPLFYSFHLELIKIFYKLGMAYKELYNTNDPVKKMLLYNLIKVTLEKIKL
jgi:hypothetical protein